MPANRDLAKWIHAEHDRVGELAHQLQKRVGVIPRVPDDSWLTDLADRFEHLRAHLHKHMALEEQDGYLSAVVERRPTLTGQIDRLKHEHHELMRIMRRISEELEDLTPRDPLLIRDCCCRVERLLEFIEHHEQEENLIVLSVFTQDIGAHD